MNKGIFSAFLAIGLVSAVFLLPIVNAKTTSAKTDKSDDINKSSMVIADDKKEESSESKNSISEVITENNETVTFIVTLKNSSLIDTVISSNGKYKNVSDLLLSDDGKEYYDKIKKEQAVVKASIHKVVPEADFSDCYTYTAAINGFSVKAPYSSIEKIRKINGVQNVTVVDEAYTQNNENTELNFGDISKSIINTDYAYSHGYTGKKILIAVIDNSFDCSHEVFSVMPDELKYDEADIDILYNSVNFNVDKSYKASDIYVSDKIVFAYDYADNDNNTYCSDSYHGTHVAGIAAGNNGTNNTIDFKGTAYDAQLAFMKVCSDEKDILSDDAILAALDDAVKIGADIVNCSYGTTKYTVSEEMNSVYEKLADIGICVVAAAGNESYNTSDSDNSEISTSYTNYGTINYPSNLSDILSVASTNTEQTLTKCFTLNGDKEIIYNDTDLIGTDDDPKNYEKLIFGEIIGEESEYIFIDNTETYKDTDIEDKTVAFVFDENTFEDKLNTLYNANAKAVIIISEDINVPKVTETKELAAVVVDSSEYKEYFEENPTGIISAGQGYTVVENGSSGKMEVYSSYGVTADLKLKPEITAPGSQIFSSVPDNKYDTVSGTSMAAPCISGAAAVIMQSINEDSALGSMAAEEKELYISELIMSTADVIKYSDDELYYTPRSQGAGLINLEKALSAKSYITLNGNKPKADMGDSETGEYSFTFTVNNKSDEDIVYNLNYAIQSDKTAKNSDGKLYNTLKPLSIAENADVKMTVDEKEVENITVQAGTSINVTVTIKLKSNFIKSNTEKFPYGFYVDGYIFLTSDNDVSLNMPFMGFCGDWSACPIFDTSIYDTADEAVISSDNSFVAIGTDSNENRKFYTLGLNFYSDENTSSEIFIGKNSIRNYFDDSSLSQAFLIPNFRILRDVYDYTISISDMSGKTLFSNNFGYVSSFVDCNSNAYDNLTDIEGADSLKTFFGSLSGGKYICTVSARTIGTDGNADKYDSVSYEFTVDDTVPKSSESKTYLKGGKIYLELSAEDNNAVQGFELYTATYNRSKEKYDYADKIDTLIEDGYISDDSYSLEEIRYSEDGSAVFVYDITNLQSQLTRLSIMSHSNTVPSSLKIVFKAVDYAFNYSSPKTADTVVCGSVSFEFTDQNGSGVSNVVMSLGNIIKSSGADGKIIFEDVMPDIYTARILSVPTDYEISGRSFIIEVSNDWINVEQEISAIYTGVVVESSEESREESIAESSSENSADVSENSDISESSDINSSEVSDNGKAHNTGDNSIYAVFFVGTLLAISVASLLVSRQRSKR